jgi:hypothetical protein
MPDTPSENMQLAEEVTDHHKRQSQEIQVRLTAQRILCAHLKPDAADLRWH